MPRAHRGRHRGQHRRRRTQHLPAAVGTIAVAAAAAGAIAVGGSGANAATRHDAVVPSFATLDAPIALSVFGTPTAESGTDFTEPSSSASALDEALAQRSEETVERSTQRERLGADVAEVEAAKAAEQRASLDATASSRLARFADEIPVWVMPVHTFTLTSMYGPRWGGMHTGLDMAAPSGTPIYAMSSGEIISAGWEGSYGRKIVIRHEDGTETWYCHQSRFAKTAGTVAAGELIGYVGSTGNSTGPHLHLEVHPGGGDAINPLSWMRGLGLPL